MAGPTFAVLTTASTLMCAHGGRLSLSTTQTRLTAATRPVLLSTDLPGATISGCATPASTSTKPCTAVTSVISGASTALEVSGTPVLTAQARGLTDGLAPAPGTWNVSDAGQTVLVTR